MNPSAIYEAMDGEHRHLQSEELPQSWLLLVSGHPHLCLYCNPLFPPFFFTTSPHKPIECDGYKRFYSCRELYKQRKIHHITLRCVNLKKSCESHPRYYIFKLPMAYFIISKAELGLVCFMLTLF